AQGVTQAARGSAAAVLLHAIAASLATHASMSARASQGQRNWMAPAESPLASRLRMVSTRSVRIPLGRTSRPLDVANWVSMRVASRTAWQRPAATLCSDHLRGRKGAARPQAVDVGRGEPQLLENLLVVLSEVRGAPGGHFGDAMHLNRTADRRGQAAA